MEQLKEGIKSALILFLLAGLTMGGVAMCSRGRVSTEPENKEAPKKRPAQKNDRATESALEDFMEEIRRSDPDAELVTNSYYKNKGTIKIEVPNAWLTLHKQVRLQSAQDLQKIWAASYSPDNPDSAYIEIVDRNGNTLGGSGMFGSVVSVED